MRRKRNRIRLSHDRDFGPGDQVVYQSAVNSKDEKNKSLATVLEPVEGTNFYLVRFDTGPRAGLVTDVSFAEIHKKKNGRQPNFTEPVNRDWFLFLA